MSRKLFLFENNWLTGPFKVDDVVSKYGNMPEANVPPIIEEGLDEWQFIGSYKEDLAGLETQMIIGGESNFFKNLPPVDVTLLAYQVCKANPKFQSTCQKNLKLFRDSGDPSYLEKIESILKKQKKVKTSDFGSYKILGLLGVGGMGKTYKALQLNMDRVVALKVLKSELAQDQNFISEFKNEAKSIAALNHPNIVQAYESGEYGGRHYLSMEFVDGESIRDRIDRDKAMPILECIEVVIDVLQALQHAHEHKIVHRDVTPGNILLSNKGDVKLTDYGLAKSIKEEMEGSDVSTTIKGSPFFISTDQIKKLKDLDIRVDIYGLGCTFYYMLTGKVPYDGKSIVEVAQGHLNKEIPNIQEILPDASDGLRKVITKMMAKDRSHRYKQPHDLMVELNEERDRYAGVESKTASASADSLNTIQDKLKEWVFGREVQILLDVEDRELTHLVLTRLEEVLEESDAIDEFFGYACTMYTELIENGFDHGCSGGGMLSIQMEVTSAFFRLIVEDTGSGFDFKKELQKIKGESGDRERRRGLKQVLAITKNITYNDIGNRVKAIIYRKSSHSKINSNTQDDMKMIEIAGKGDSLLTKQFEEYIRGYDLSDPKRVCLMIKTPWVASLFVTHIATLQKKLTKTGSPFCVFVENHSCFKVMKLLGVTEFVNTYESMNDAMAYLNFSTVDGGSSVAKVEEMPGYSGKPKKIIDEESQIEMKAAAKDEDGFDILEEVDESLDSKSIFNIFKKNKK
ncbi:MAG: hypothetical protein COA79_14280 [Planctomycetota bacterium]|nr:MAG: hypothetical protein COA79_14280 [Planctomycetota bacterium]